MIEPRYSHLVAFPLAWSSPTSGVETAKALYAPFKNKNRYDLAASKVAFEQYKKEWKGKLKGYAVLITDIDEPKPTTQPLFRRDAPENLAEIAKAPEPAVSRNISVEDLKIPSDPAEARKYVSSLPNAVVNEFFDRLGDFATERSKFFREEGAAAVITADTRAHNGLLFAEAASSEKASAGMAAPTFVVTEEQYSRMTRLLEKNTPVSLRFNLQVKASDKDIEAVNIIGEIPGRTKPDQIVMIGAHFRQLAFRHRSYRQWSGQRRHDGSDAHSESGGFAAGPHRPHRPLEWRRAGVARLASLRGTALRRSEDHAVEARTCQARRLFESR